MNKELPHPKSAPVWSPLQQSANLLRMPLPPPSSHKRFQSDFQSPSTTPSPLKMSMSVNTSFNTKHGKKNSSSNDLTSPYSTIHERKSSVAFDTKRLVDQFYSQESSSSSFSTPLTRQATGSTSTLAESISGESSLGQNSINVENYNFLMNSINDNNDNNDNNGNTVDKDKIQCDIQELKRKVIETVSNQISETNQSFNQDSNDFKLIFNELIGIKLKFLKHINLISSKQEIFIKDYSNFKVELENLYKSLEILNNFEKTLINSRSKLNLNKRKLFELRKKIEINEDLKLKQFEMTQIRKKWIIIGLLMILISFILYNIL